jgi:hypothetical protein
MKDTCQPFEQEMCFWHFCFLEKREVVALLPACLSCDYTRCLSDLCARQGKGDKDLHERDVFSCSLPFILLLLLLLFKNTTNLSVVFRRYRRALSGLFCTMKWKRGFVFGFREKTCLTVSIHDVSFQAANRFGSQCWPCVWNLHVCTRHPTNTSRLVGFGWRLFVRDMTIEHPVAETSLLSRRGWYKPRTIILRVFCESSVYLSDVCIIAVDAAVIDSPTMIQGCARGL